MCLLWQQCRAVMAYAWCAVAGCNVLNLLCAHGALHLDVLTCCVDLTCWLDVLTCCVNLTCWLDVLT